MVENQCMKPANSSVIRKTETVQLCIISVLIDFINRFYFSLIPCGTGFFFNKC